MLRRKNTRGRDKDVISGHGWAGIDALEDPWKASPVRFGVKSGNLSEVYPQKRTSLSAIAMSHLCTAVMEAAVIAINCEFSPAVDVEASAPSASLTESETDWKDESEIAIGNRGRRGRQWRGTCEQG